MESLIAKTFLETTAADTVAINNVSQTYTIPSDGYLTGSISGNGGAAGVVYVNGNARAGQTSTTPVPILIFVRKGDVITSRNIGAYDVRFYPIAVGGR